MSAEQSAADKAAQREWERARKSFKNDTVRYGFGTDAAKKAWKERIQRTRSF